MKTKLPLISPLKSPKSPKSVDTQPLSPTSLPAINNKTVKFDPKPSGSDKKKDELNTP